MLWFQDHLLHVLLGPYPSHRDSNQQIFCVLFILYFSLLMEMICLLMKIKKKKKKKKPNNCKMAGKLADLFLNLTKCFCA